MSVHEEAMAVPRVGDVGEFVRGYFSFLDDCGVAACVLHDWEDGFRGALSDVDYVVESVALGRVVGLVHDYCGRTGWRLCQVMWHETTAVYCVCAAVVDPRLVVALDACGDYQQDRAALIGGAELLAGRVPLPWGGYRLRDEMELRYRFAKAAIKEKRSAWAATEFAGYGPEIRTDCENWLRQCWQIPAMDWSADSIAAALDALRKRANAGRIAVWNPAVVRLKLKRFWEPAGMYLVTGTEFPAVWAQDLAREFARLYFRRAQAAGTWRARLIHDMIRSGLVLVDSLPTWVRILVRRDCVFAIELHRDYDRCVEELAARLHARCLKRERLSANPILSRPPTTSPPT